MKLCLACGRPKAECLVQLGSLRCHACRAENKPLSRSVIPPARPA